MFAKERMGFMPALYLAFMDELKPEEKTRLTSCTSQEKRAEMVLNHPFVKDKFDMIKLYDGKNNAKSVEAREEGNKYFQDGNFKAASNKYSTAVAFADQGSKEYSLALANRSAALQRLNQAERGIVDIDLAIKAGYPKDKMYKLLERKGQLLLEQKLYEDAQENFKIAKKHVANSSLSSGKQDKFLSDIEKQIKKIQGKENIKTSEKTSSKSSEFCQIDDVHPLYTSLHRKVEVKYTKEQGRFTVAKEKIPAGTTVLAEDPLGWALEVEKFGTNCQHCLGQISVIIPCQYCTSVAFCCVECKDQAMADYHGRECGLMGVLAASALNNFCLLTVRALARYTAKDILDMKSDMKPPDIKHGKTEASMGLYDSSDIRTGLNLVHHSEYLGQDDTIMRTLISVFLMKCLKQTKFYQNTSVNKEDDLFIAKVIYTLINACPANTHEIHTLNTPTMERWSPMAEMKAIGAGLYPTAALFNHSCDPNIIRCNVGRKMISVASRDIQPGEEIQDCYGLPWYSKTRDERQNITNKFYKFSCICRACKDGWVTSDLLGLYSVSELSRLVCSCGAVVVKKDGRFLCDKCGKESDPKNIDLQKLRGEVQSAGERLYTDLDWAGGCAALSKAYSNLASQICPPTLEYFNLQISIWRALWMIVGNKKLSKLF